MARSSAPTESALRKQLAREGLTPTRWANGPRALYGLHEHPYGTVLLVVSGRITFTVSAHRVVAMGPGDRLTLPPRTPHRAVVGPDGVVCLEAHLPASGRDASTGRRCCSCPPPP